MIIVGCDYHPSFQQIAFMDTETGEVRERRLSHREDAEKFYRALERALVGTAILSESEMALFYEYGEWCAQLSA